MVYFRAKNLLENEHYFMIGVALYQPDIPQNAGTIARLCRCMDCDLHIIEPAGFATTEKAFRRAGMDYIDQLNLTRHSAFEQFLMWCESQKRRVVLLTTKANLAHVNFQFEKNDILLLGRESAGVPEHVQNIISQKIKIPMARDVRSLNIAVSCAMVLNEALRQQEGFPPL